MSAHGSFGGTHATTDTFREEKMKLEDADNVVERRDVLKDLQEQRAKFAKPHHKIHVAARWGREAIVELDDLEDLRQPTLDYLDKCIANVERELTDLGVTLPDDAPDHGDAS